MRDTEAVPVAVNRDLMPFGGHFFNQCWVVIGQSNPT